MVIMLSNSEKSRIPQQEQSMSFLLRYIGLPNATSSRKGDRTGFMILITRSVQQEAISRRSFLKDADAKKHASETVRNFVEEIKEISFDAEDIIETFLLKEDLRKTSGIKMRMRRLSCFIVDRKAIASDIGGLSKRISKVIRDMQSFGVQQMIVDGKEYSHPLQERQRELRKTFPSNY
ncbi:predicted protein [Arabidopsis lyrata subsp. lyrata]|uniref:Predicted protein n=1 Tax=Arabidopsis lyrata subsp. lyrata TaxID=81972 RepID=D7KXG2_ARALL|nr:predicted protein [Arabidopsis lyrata subsp. lyrata]